MLMMFYSMANFKKQVESLFKKKIQSGESGFVFVFSSSKYHCRTIRSSSIQEQSPRTWECSYSVFPSYHELVCRFDEIRKFDALRFRWIFVFYPLRHLPWQVPSTGTVYLFIASNEVLDVHMCLKEILGGLIAHIGSGVKSEVDAALNTLCNLVENPIALKPYIAFIKGTR